MPKMQDITTSSSGKDVKAGHFVARYHTNPDSRNANANCARDGNYIVGRSARALAQEKEKG